MVTGQSRTELSKIQEVGVISPRNRTRKNYNQSVMSRLGRTGESEMAEKRTPFSEQVSPRLANFFFSSLALDDFLIRASILGDCSQSTFANALVKTVQIVGVGSGSGRINYTK